MIKRFSSGSTFEQAIGYSRAVADDRYVFVSGTTGFDYATMTIQPDARTQAERCCANIADALEQAGCTPDDVVRVSYIFPDRADFEPCWPVFKRFFGKAKPAATMIVAGLFDERMKLEIEVIARLPQASPPADVKDA